MIHEMPMVAEHEASGTVRTVYVDIRRHHPYVPLLYQALAIQPTALVLAWQHAKALLDEPGFADAVRQLGLAAEAAAPALPLAAGHLSRARQSALSGIAGYAAAEAPADALICAHLSLALAGQVEGTPALAKPPATARRKLPDPELELIDPDTAPPALQRRFRQVRAMLGLPFVPSLWRLLASDPVLLDTVWDGLHARLPRLHVAAHERELVGRVRSSALTLSPAVLCNADALAKAKIGETQPAIRRLATLFAASALRQLLLSHLLTRALPAREATPA